MSPDTETATGVLRGVVAGVLFAAFLLLWLWAYSARRKPGFEAAARLPLEEDSEGDGTS
jgi:cytochrome c oxidase cbb3-type subunit IV